MNNTITAPAPKPWIMGIAPYVPGKAKGDDGRPLAKLSANENPLGTGAAARAAFAAAAEDLSRYPDPGAAELRAAIAAKYGLDPARIIYGTGSDELLHLAASAFAGPGDEVLYVRYGFAVYDIAARRVGAITGTLATRADIARLHAGLPADVLFVLDQAYAEYLEEEEDDGGLELAMHAPNVFITRTFSKIHGLAAERIGWGYASGAVIGAMHRIRAPFNVTTCGQQAAIAAINDDDFVSLSRRHNRIWRDWLADEVAALGNHGLRAVPSACNFLLILFEGAVSAETAYKGLMDAGYIVRWLPGQGLPHGLRITIGTEAETRGVAEALRRIVAGD
jgi:histidinol-phosphate aminotransferase